MLAFNGETKAFMGSVENTTERVLCAVHFEVHLAGGIELGPTERTDVPAGESIEVVRHPAETVIGRALASLDAIV